MRVLQDLAWLVVLSMLGYGLVYGSAVVWADAVEAEAVAVSCSVCEFAPTVVEVQ